MSVEDALSQSKSRLEALLAPINGGVGEDVSYDEDFERMKAEVDKLQAIDGGKVDWQVLRDYGKEILESRSKDFRVALYYAAAIGHTHGLNGVLDGLVLLQELTAAFWEPMYPSLKRPRARGNLVGWYSDAVAPAVEAIQPTDRDVCLALDQVVKAVDADLAAKLGEAYGQMGALLSALRGVVSRAPAPPPPPRPEGPAVVAATEDAGPATLPPASIAGAAAGTGSGGPTPDDISDPASAYEALKTTQNMLFKAAEVLLNASPSDADGFRFSRHGAWLLKSGPDAANDAQAPNPDAVDSVKAQLASGAWAELANNADIVTTQSPFWLDGVRYLAVALENLGEEFAVARASVVAETIALLARIPGLAEKTFVDGTPFADDETKAWLSGLGTGGGGGGGGGGAANPVARAALDARKLAENDQLPQAVSLLSRVVRDASNESTRFRGRLEIARLCFDFSVNDVAMAQLDVLERSIEQYQLRTWEPALAAQVYAVSYRIQRTVFNAGGGDADTSRKMSQALERLTELDASEALRVVAS